MIDKKLHETIHHLLEEGYTHKQIVAALRDDFHHQDIAQAFRKIFPVTANAGEVMVEKSDNGVVVTLREKRSTPRAGISP